jgi:hypothetical protein
VINIFDFAIFRAYVISSAVYAGEAPLIRPPRDMRQIPVSVRRQVKAYQL